MFLKEKLEKLILQEISDTDLFHFNDFSKENGKLINYLIKSHYLDANKIDEALDTAIKNMARESFNHTANSGKVYSIYADHVISPRALAYGIKHGIFSEKELSRIKFDSEKNPADFCLSYNPNSLLKELKNQLLNNAIQRKLAV